VFELLLACLLLQAKRVSSDSPTITALKSGVVRTTPLFYAVMGTP